jgi:hypothetical protein
MSWGLNYYLRRCFSDGSSLKAVHLYPQKAAALDRYCARMAVLTQVSPSPATEKGVLNAVQAHVR